MNNLSPTEKIQVDLRGYFAVITINNSPANTWDLESLSGLSVKRRGPSA